jgi:hypothetical protein
MSIVFQDSLSSLPVDPEVYEKEGGDKNQEKEHLSS